MEIEEKELDQEWWDSQAILIKNWWLGLHAANCRQKALECDTATSFIAHIMHEVLNQIVRGDKTSGCKIQYVQRKDWLSILPIYAWTAMIEHRITVRLYVMWASTECQRSVNGASMERQWNVNGTSMIHSLSHSAIKRLHCDILTKWMYWTFFWLKDKWNARCHTLEMSVNGASTTFCLASWIIQMLGNYSHSLSEYWPPFEADQLGTTLRLSPKNERQRSVNKFWSCIWNDPGAAQRHLPTLHVSATFQSKNAREDIATIS